MSAIASQITSLKVYSTFYSGANQRIHQISALLAFVNSLVTGEFPAQMASNAENVSIWWRHHGKKKHQCAMRTLSIWKRCPHYWPLCEGNHRSAWIPSQKASNVELLARGGGGGYFLTKYSLKWWYLYLSWQIRNSTEIDFSSEVNLWQSHFFLCNNIQWDMSHENQHRFGYKMRLNSSLPPVDYGKWQVNLYAKVLLLSKDIWIIHISNI